MTRRMIRTMATALALCSCADDSSGGPPPAVSSTANASLTLGSGGGTDTDSGTDTDTATATGTDATMSGTPTGDDSTTGPPEMFTVMCGGFIQGAGTVNLPIDCRVRAWAPGQIDPDTGVEQGGMIFQRSFSVDEFPQEFCVESEEVPSVDFGDSFFAGAECDIDGDGAFDDDVGGFYPGLPLLEITAPASGIFIPISPS